MKSSKQHAIPVIHKLYINGLVQNCSISSVLAMEILQSCTELSTCDLFTVKSHQIPKVKCFSSRLAVVFAQSAEAMCEVKNEDVVGAAPTGDAPTTSEWSTNFIAH